MKIVKYSRGRWSCHSFSLLDYIILTWFKRAKPQIYCFLMGESKALGFENDENYDEKSSKNEKSGKSPGSSQIMSGMFRNIGKRFLMENKLPEHVKNDEQNENLKLS